MQHHSFSALIAIFTLTATLVSPPVLAAVKINDVKSPSLLIKGDDPNVYSESQTLSTDTTIQVSGLTARVMVKQAFKNEGSEVLNGVYVFPLPDNAAIDTLILKIGERTIEGQVHEKRKAKAIFVEAKKAGKKAALLEQIRPNLFTNAVANINPGESVEVTIAYQQTLRYQSGAVSLRYPMAVTPRYDPGSGSSAQSLSALPLSNTQLKINLDAGFALANISTGVHHVQLERHDSDSASVHLDSTQTQAQEDFVLTWTPKPTEAPQAVGYQSFGDEYDHALFVIMPPQGHTKSNKKARETIFVLDTSGSMGGRAIRDAKSALARAIARTDEGDRFNVIEFNSNAFTLFKQPQLATKENVEAALEWVAKLSSRGGTEMAQAFNMAFAQAQVDERESQVLFMTDGAVTNENELFKLISDKLGKRRLFTVGIGGAPNTFFMKKAADFGRGTFTFIASPDEIEEKMGELFAKLDAPVVENLSIVVDGQDVEMEPQEIGDLFSREPIVVSVRAKGLGNEVRVKGKRAGKKFETLFKIQKAKSQSGIDKLWARRKIERLLDEERAGEGPRKDAVVATAIDHHLVSKYTSLVAVDVTPTAQGKSTTHRLQAPPPAGHLPQGGTAANLLVFFGLALLGMSMLSVLQKTREREAAKQ